MRGEETSRSSGRRSDGAPVPSLRLVGPGFDDGLGGVEGAARVPTGGTYQPDREALDLSRSTVDDAGDETDGGRLFRRLLVALGAIVVLLFGNAIMMQQFGLGLPGEILLSAFAVIAIAGVVAGLQGQEPKPEREAESDGCAVGMCPGPRPPRFLRK